MGDSSGGPKRIPHRSGIRRGSRKAKTAFQPHPDPQPTSGWLHSGSSRGPWVMRAQIKFQGKVGSQDSTGKTEDSRGPRNSATIANGPNPKQGTETILSVPETRTRHSVHGRRSVSIEPAPEGPPESHTPSDHSLRDPGQGQNFPSTSASASPLQDGGNRASPTGREDQMGSA